MARKAYREGGQRACYVKPKGGVARGPLRPVVNARDGGDDDDDDDSEGDVSDEDEGPPGKRLKKGKKKPTFKAKPKGKSKEKSPPKKKTADKSFQMPTPMSSPDLSETEYE